MLVVTALTAAVVYGVADYLGGRASRHSPAMVVTLLGQTAALLVLGAAAFASRVPFPPASDWMWGGLAGLAGSSGLIAFYRAMGSGFMTVAGPISAVTTGAVPVIIGLATGERPGVLALLGMPIALGAVVLVADAFGPGHRRAPWMVIILAFTAGLVFGSLFVLLDRTSSDSGIWPVVAMRVASVPYMALLVRGSNMWLKPGNGNLGVIVAAGILDSTANALFLAATRLGMMSVAAVIIALYPASTLLLAVRLDKEKIHPPQVAGLALAAGALVLITLS
jgi:drug/metabolite transporter (DMT)-like permease